MTTFEPCDASCSSSDEFYRRHNRPGGHTWSCVVNAATRALAEPCPTHPPARVSTGWDHDPERRSCAACREWWWQYAYAFSTWGRLKNDGTVGHMPADPAADAALVLETMRAEPAEHVMQTSLF